MELYFQSLTLNSDDGWLFNNWTEYPDTAFASDDSDFYSVSNNDLNSSRFTFQIYSDKNLNTIQRSYMKVSDLLAKLGGVLQSLMFFSYIIIYFEHSLFMKNTILNSLFLFHTKDQNKASINPKNTALNNFVQTNLEVQNIESTIITSKTRQKNSRKFPSGKLIRCNFKTIKRKTIELFDLNKKKGAKLMFTMLKYLWMRMKNLLPFMKLTHKEEIFRKSEKVYEKEVDFIALLKKLHDIDKLKQILLSHHQQTLFNFLSKPVIHLNDPNFRRVKMNYSINLEKNERDNKEDLKEALNHYENLKNQKGFTEIDERLFEVLQENIKKFN